MTRKYIIVSGLPASGKSTIGEKLAELLDFRYIDKDTFLEKLFVSRGIGNTEWRQKLSRDSDVQFVGEATRSKKAVVVSHWKTDTTEALSGTSTDWLRNPMYSVVEIYCSCSVETAVSRFELRQRHSGHLDNLKSKNELIEWMGRYQQGLPLEIGELVAVQSDRSIDMESIVERIGDTSIVNT